MHNKDETVDISDDEFGSDHDSAAEDDLLVKYDENLLGGMAVPLSPTHPGPSQRTTTTLGSSSTSIGNPQVNSTPVPMCTICNEKPAYRNGPGGIYPTCGLRCNSTKRSHTGLPDQNLSRSTSDSQNNFGPIVRSSERLDTFGYGHWSANSQCTGRSSETNRTYASITGPTGPYYSGWRPNQIRMCDVCHVRPRCQRGGRIYPTCGLSCAAKLHAPGSVEMCDYCKKRPKVVINGKTYPQCGNTCREKVKLAKEAAANAAACTSCILCWKATKSGISDFCSDACASLADARAPFLIEIPRGHVAFKTVAEHFTSGWQTKTQCPTIKKVYMVVMEPGFKKIFERYRSHNGLLQSKKALSTRWLVISRECGFGDPGDLEPCSSMRCLLCCIVKSSFNRLDFPAGITTSESLNSAVEHYRGGKKSSSKIAGLTDVVVGREALMTSDQVGCVSPIPPQDYDSIHVIRVRGYDGAKVSMGNNIVYEGDAVRPLYLISYE